MNTNLFDNKLALCKEYLLFRNLKATFHSVEKLNKKSDILRKRNW